MISEIIAGMVQGLYMIIETLVNNGRVKETVKEHIVKNEFIHKRLDNLLHDVKSNRVSIIQYHNGGYYFTGLPMQKYSYTYEAVSEGISTELPTNQNKLVSETPVLHSSIIKDNEYYIDDVSKLEDQVLKQKLQHRGVKSFYALGIWDIRDNLVGLICVDYVISKHEMSDKDREEISDFANLASGYLVAAPAKQPKSLAITLVVFGLTFIIILSQIVFLFSSAFSFIRYLFF